jgi:hypothetical protein
MSRPLWKPPISARWPSRRKLMTICIAAICQQDEQNDEPRIVLCYDWKAEQQYGGSETSDKMRELPKGWVALMAGTMPRAEELVAEYATHFESMKQVADRAALFAEMKKPARKQKENLVTEYIWQTMGVSYSDLVSPNKKFPESIVEQRLNEVAQIKLGATIILAGFSATDHHKEARERLPYIFVVDGESSPEDIVRIEENFSAIGTGSYVAIPAMHQREHDEAKSLMETIYSIDEAKRLSQVVPGVGETTTINVMYPDGTLKRWSNALFDRLDHLYGHLGPTLDIKKKDAQEFFAFKDEYLIPIDADEEEEKPKTTRAKRSASQTPEQAQ